MRTTTPINRRLAKLYQTIVRWGQRTCEMCPQTTNAFLGLQVHHPLGRTLKHQYDPRNGIVLCQGCHETYDHNPTRLIRDMLSPLKVDQHGKQARWIKRHLRDKPLQKAWYDEMEVLEKLQTMLVRLHGGETREKVRKWGR